MIYFLNVFEGEERKEKEKYIEDLILNIFTFIDDGNVYNDDYLKAFTAMKGIDGARKDLAKWLKDEEWLTKTYSKWCDVFKTPHLNEQCIKLMAVFRESTQDKFYSTLMKIMLEKDPISEANTFHVSLIQKIYHLHQF